MKNFQPTKYVSELEKLFLSRSNPMKAIKMKAYMRNQFEYIGLSSPERAELTKSFYFSHHLPLMNA
jgi:hypothetical protein